MPEPEDADLERRTRADRRNPEIDYAGQAESDTVLHEFWDLSVDDIFDLEEAGMAPDPDPGANQGADE